MPWHGLRGVPAGVSAASPRCTACARHLCTAARGVLQTLEQYVQDTEDLVNTSLDTQRNRIIATGESEHFTPFSPFP